MRPLFYRKEYAMKPYKYLSWCYLASLVIIPILTYSSASGIIVFSYYIPFILLIFTSAYLGIAKEIKLHEVRWLSILEYILKCILFVLDLIIAGYLGGNQASIGAVSVILIVIALIVIALDFVLVIKIYNQYYKYISSGGVDTFDIDYIFTEKKNGMTRYEEGIEVNQVDFKLSIYKILPLLILLSVPMNFHNIWEAILFTTINIAAVILVIKSVRFTLKILANMNLLNFKNILVYMILELIPLVLAIYVNVKEYNQLNIFVMLIVVPYIPIARLTNRLTKSKFDDNV